MTRKGKKKSEKLKVVDYLNFIVASRKLILQRVDASDELVAFLLDYEKILKHNLEQDIHFLIEALKTFAPSTTNKKKLTKLGFKRITEPLSLGEIKTMLTDTTLSKDTLLQIADNLGMPIGSLRKLSKKKLIDEINTVIQNRETFDTIRKVVSEQGRE